MSLQFPLSLHTSCRSVFLDYRTWPPDTSSPWSCSALLETSRAFKLQQYLIHTQPQTFAAEKPCSFGWRTAHGTMVFTLLNVILNPLICRCAVVEFPEIYSNLLHWRATYRDWSEITSSSFAFPQLVQWLCLHHQNCLQNSIFFTLSPLVASLFFIFP